MKNWMLLAAGLDTGLSATEIEKIALVLDALEAVFRPLAAALPHEAEPAVTFDAAVEERS
jgi:hypothetical protein